MTRPTSVTVGPWTLRIVSDKRTDSILDELERRGDTDLSEGVIRIYSRLANDIWAETLAHEVLHVVWGLAAIAEIEKPTEEQVVSMLSPWLRTLGFLDTLLAGRDGNA